MPKGNKFWLILCLTLLPSTSLATSWTEDFAASGVVGSGQGTSYTAGTNWEVQHGRVVPRTANGDVKCSLALMSESGAVGPWKSGDGAGVEILNRRVADGVGTYTWDFTGKAAQPFIGYDKSVGSADTAPKNMFVLVQNTTAVSRSVPGESTVTTNWCLGAYDGTTFKPLKTPGATNYTLTANCHTTLSITWDPAASTLSATITVVDGSTLLNNVTMTCSTSNYDALTYNPTTGYAGISGKHQDDQLYITATTFTQSGGNTAPTVNAGSDQNVYVGMPATLNGAVSDDGLPASPGKVALVWSKVSGPTGGAAAFSNPFSLNTTVNLSTAGTYVLELLADDGELQDSDTVTITVNSLGSPTLSEDFTNTSVCGTGTGVNYVAGANWTMASGYAQVTTSDGGQSFGAAGTCRLGYTGSPKVGPGGTPHKLFTNSSYGAGTYTARSYRRAILYIGYQDSSNYYIIDTFYSGHTGLSGNQNIAVGKCINGATTWITGAKFAGGLTEGADGDRYEVSVTWNPTYNEFTSVSLVCKNSSETVRDSCAITIPFSDDIGEGTDWTTGKFGVYTTGELKIDKLTFTDISSNNQGPRVDAGNYQVVKLPTSQVNLDGTVTDDGLPVSATTTWSQVSGPGGASFGNTSAVDTTFNFSTAGTYVLKLRAYDTAFEATDTVTIVVKPSDGDSETLAVTGPLRDPIGPAPKQPYVTGYRLVSSYQGGDGHETYIRILRPESPDPSKQSRVLFVMPASPGSYGTGWENKDALALIRDNGWHNQYNLTVVHMSFSVRTVGDANTYQTPWWADNPNSNYTFNRQESYFIKHVVPLADSLLPDTVGRKWLIGYSKSGFGALNMLLMHEPLFEAAAAFDSPLATTYTSGFTSNDMLTWCFCNNAGTGVDQNNFDNYLIKDRVPGTVDGNLTKHAVGNSYFTQHNRIYLAGWTTVFEPGWVSHNDMNWADTTMTSGGIQHTYNNVQYSTHAWDASVSGQYWVGDALQEMDTNNP